MKKWVYSFSEGGKDMRDLLGGKGAGLAEMTRAGLPVPPGFTITTEACNAYFAAGRRLPDGLWDQVGDAVAALEEGTGKRFGDPDEPLLLSVRSGARFSMPGMMDTVLDVGMHPRVVEGMSGSPDRRRFALDCYRRLIQMFGHTVKGIDEDRFEEVRDRCGFLPAGGGGETPGAEVLEQVVAGYLDLYAASLGEAFPEDPEDQLHQSVEAVFASWFGRRAVDYRNFHRIPHDLGTAVNVMAMVYGNRGGRSATGVAFTRDPATGERRLFGEYLMNAQGEDVVAGARTPAPIADMEKDLPEAFQAFARICGSVERHYRDMQDLEFTVEEGRLYVLQTRTGKRTAQAAVTIAVDMVEEGLITREEAVGRISPDQIDHLMLPRFDPRAKGAAAEAGRLLGWGLNASPGAATGLAVFDADTAARWAEAGKDVILVRPETTPDDVHGMLAASGILTQRGGATSHAAVVARGLGKPCVTGCETLRVDPVRKNFRSADLQIAEGDPVSIDGATGEVFAGLIPTVAPDLDRQTAVSTLMEWADAVCRTDCRVGHDGRPRGGLQVWANADYPRDARIARRFGARGIGLCRTEHMFFEADRLPKVHQMILNAVDAQERYRAVERAEEELTRRPADGSLQARLEEARRRRARSGSVRRYEAALEELQAVQRRDFEELFEVMDGLPVIVRLIDPPLHEFLPRHDDLLAEVTVLETRIEAIRSKEGAGPDEEATLTALAAELDEKAPLLAAVRAMRESNPMLGMRGIRLGLCFPGIVKMQVRAIFEAACRKAEEGVVVRPEIMIPLTGHVNELAAARRMLEAAAQEVIEARGQGVPYAFGTMIEVPRSALTAADIAREAEFFSFGTNDLTQMTFGYSRDDAEGKFLRYYVESGILPENPFQVIDRDGVGRLVRMAVTEGRRARGDLELGICGEHGGDPDSIAFCHEAGLDYVSCSPYRVMVARLAAAQAALGRIERDR